MAIGDFSVGDVLRWNATEDGRRLAVMFGEPLRVVEIRGISIGKKYVLERAASGQRLQGLFCCENCVLDPFLTAVKRAADAEIRP